MPNETKYLKDYLNDAIDRVTELYVRTCGVSETLSLIAEKADGHKDALCNLTMSLNEISRGMRVLRGYLYNDISRYGHVQESDAAPNPEPTATETAVSESEPIDREKYLRMIAEAVSGLTRKDWNDAKEKIDRLFSYPANAASNRVTIGKTPEEIMDTLGKDW